MENKISKTIDTIICINNKENKFLYHILKNQDVFSKHNDNIANGDNNTNIFTITYLKAYTVTKLSNDIVVVPFINPSTVNISNVSEVIFKFVFIDCIKLEKHTSLLNKSSPILLIAKEIFDVKSKNCCIIKYEQFMQIPKIINLKINCIGFSVLEKVKFDVRCFMAKYNINPINSEFATNNIPFEADVPKILLKYLSFNISEFIKVKSSNTLYKLVSIDENKFSKIAFIVFITVVLTFELFSN